MFNIYNFSLFSSCSFIFLWLYKFQQCFTYLWKCLTMAFNVPYHNFPIHKTIPLYSYVQISLVIYLSIFWGICVLNLVMNFIPWFGKFKIQPKKNIPMTSFFSILKLDIFNQIVVSLPVFILYRLCLNINLYWDASNIPSGLYAALQIIFYIGVAEIFFYYIHRLMHAIPFLYGNIHKYHHKYTAPLSCTSIYAHPLEHLFNNLLPVFIGPLIWNCHFIVLTLWINLASINACIVHSGYEIPFISKFVNPRFHDFHHLNSGSNYGILGILDNIHQTKHKIQFSCDDNFD